jgi:hypothetical protein
MASSNINIASVTSPDIIKNISSSENIKAFGDQIKDQAKEKIIAGGQDKIKEIGNKQIELIKQEIEAGLTKNNTIKKAEQDYNTKQITEDQYDRIVQDAQIAYDAKIKNINEEKKKLQQDINNIINDPYKKIKDKQKEIKEKIKKLKKQIQSKDKKAKKELAKKVLSNAAKTLAPVIALQLVNNFISVISQRKQLEELVNQVNEYIDTQVKDQSTVTIATNLRNNAVTLINNNIKKLQAIENIIKTITTIITTITLVVTVIERILSLPIPALLPVKVQLQPILQKILKLISAVNTVLVIVTNLLESEISILVEIRERLKEISLKLDGKTLDSLDDQEFTDLVNVFAPVGTLNFPSYKGFKFKLKEENNPKFVVKDNKRRYAVAIDRDGVEVLKSDFSFTLDPNDLIEQLKLVIDQRNLQG